MSIGFIKCIKLIIFQPTLSLKPLADWREGSFNTLESFLEVCNHLKNSQMDICGFYFASASSGKNIVFYKYFFFLIKKKL